MKRMTLFLLAGLSGGLLVWVVTEPIAWFHWAGVGYDVNYTAVYVQGALLGLAIGGLLGAAEGWNRGSTRLAFEYGSMGILAGSVGGFLGISTGQGIYGPWATFNERLRAGSGPLSLPLEPFAYASGLAARTVGWSLIGLFVGAAVGFLRYSPRRMTAAVWGGFLGGAVGGFAFELIAALFHGGALSRAIGFCMVGAGTGFGIAAAQQISRQAWVRVVEGRNEGRDYLLEKEANSIGRNEQSDVPLFGDPSIGKTHAYIKRVNGIWYLQDAGNSIGTQVNGQAVRERALIEGDRIGIARFIIEYHQRGGHNVRAAERDIAPSPLPAVAAPDGTCAFCGELKDRTTGACACSPIASASAAGGPDTVSSAPSQSSAYLEVTAGPYAGQRYPVGECLTIGRAEGCGIALAADPMVSRRHASVSGGLAGLTLRDEGSSNGTFVNGARVTDSTLRPGDEVSIGSTRFKVVY